jgi:hypothetical protein
MTSREERRRGRRPLDPEDGSVTASVRLRARDYDALCRRARLLQTSLSDVIRRELEPPDPADKRIFK